MKRRRRSGGSTVLEFALVGIPMVLAFVSVVEIGLTMWTYTTLAYAAKEVNRYIAVHGKHCSAGSNSCTLTVATVATAAENYALGLSSGTLSMTLTSPNGTYTCNPVSSCSTNTNQWPPTADSTVGTVVKVKLQYAVNPVLTMVWPGAKPATYGSYNLWAYSATRVLF
jgi:Flp pilus assembly protein TadG